MNNIYLTFDDLPSDNTIKLLDILGDNKATFFIQGNYAEKYPEVVEEIDKRGHTIGNHTYDHPHLDKLSFEDQYYQIKRTNLIIQNITGKQPTLFRPPYGIIDKRTELVIEMLSMKMVFWNVNSQDWKGISTDEIMSNIPDKLSNSIIIFHDRMNNTLEAIPKILNKYKDYVFNKF